MAIPATTGQYWPPIATQIISAGGSMMPTYIGPTETFTIPEYRQGVSGMVVEIDAGGLLVIDGYFIEVD